MISPSVSELVDGEVYVPGLPAEHLVDTYGIPADQISKLGSAENPHGTSPMARRAVEQVLDRMSIYPEWTSRQLREAIARRYGVQPEGVVCGSGETEVIALVIRAYAGPGEPVLMHAPCFPLYRIFATMDGRQPVYVPMGKDFNLEMDRYLEALRNRPKVAFLTSPHNPSGQLVSEADVRRVCEAAHEDTLVVLDEAYIHYSETEGSVHLLREYANLMVLRTFSKAYGLAGLRVGFGMSGNPALVEPLRRLKPTWNVGQLQLAGAIAGLQDDAHVQRAVKTVVDMRGYVAEQMARMTRFRMVPNSRANFFLTEILDPSLDSDSVFEGLLKRGVIVKNGNHIEGLGSRYLRVDLNLKVHMDRFLNALNDLPAR
jgi:histidinol-phosphate aminotransferase